MKDRTNSLTGKLKMMVKHNKVVSIIAAVVAIILIVVLIIVIANACGKSDDSEKTQSSKEEKDSVYTETSEKNEETTLDITSEQDDSDKDKTTDKESTQETTEATTTVEETTTTVQETTSQSSAENETTTSANVSTTGISKLHVEGTKLVNEQGQVVRLKGISTHGIAWFPQYVNLEAFRTLRDSFRANVIRVAMYSDPNAGYTVDMHRKVDEAVSYATELGMYVIIDWHILSDGNPQTYKSQAKAFFTEMSAKYKDYDNVLYEICNEPNGCDWNNDVKPYALEIIQTIRANDPDGIILVGTTTWSQDVDIAADNPITGYDNIMYTLHFYAATHTDWIRQKLEYAMSKGIPVFVSEFSICDASGNGWNDINSGNTWMQLLDRYGISFVGWNLSNKNESSAIIADWCNTTSGWSDSDLSESGKWLVNQIRNR